MRLNYIAKIQAGLKRYKRIPTNRATSRILDGSYNSIYKGRSMNFDELREYVPGDEIKDIDWKATSRSQRVLVRQYIAEKKHNIMLVLDTNRRMLAHTEQREEKRELAILTAGTLAYLVNTNGDYVSAMFSGENGLENFPFKTSVPYLENILNRYHNAITVNNESSMQPALEFIRDHMNRRMILVIVTDLYGIYNLPDSLLKQLLITQDILVFQIGDTTYTGKNSYGVEGQNYLPAFLTESRRLAKFEKKQKEAMKKACEDKLKRYGIGMVTIDREEELDTQIIRLLEQHKLEKR